MNAINIYRTTTTLKIVRPQGSILSTQLIPEFQDFQTDRYISNEIEILKSYTIREKVAMTLLDSFKINPDKKAVLYHGQCWRINPLFITFINFFYLIDKGLIKTGAIL